MAEISAQLVKQLRDKTGVGMGKCKEALTANAGDLKKAEEWLRAQGVKTETLSRATGEGALIVRVAPDGKSASAVELKCETDFAAKNDRFRKLATDIADTVLAKGAKDLDAAQKLPLGTGTVADQIRSEIAGVIKENIQFSWFEHRKLDGAGKVGTYVHSNGKLAVLVGVAAPNEAAAKKPEFDTLIKDIAMHVAGAAPAPVAVDRASVPTDLIETEKRIIMKQLDEDPKESKKPANIKEKIAEGKMGRFYKERVLGEQPYVKDDSKTVDQHLAEVGKTLGGTPKVLWFVRRQLGG